MGEIDLTNTQTHTDPTTITLAMHVHRGLTIVLVIMEGLRI